MRRKVFNLLSSLAITLLFLYLVFREQNLKEFIALLTKINSNGVVLFCIISIIAALLRTKRYQVLLLGILPHGEVPSSLKLLITTLARNAFVDLLPLRLGEIVYLYMLNRFGVSIISGISSFGICIVLDILVLLFIFSVLLFFALFSNLIGDLGIAVNIFGLIGLVVLVLGFSFFFYKADNFLQRIVRMINNSKKSYPIVGNLTLKSNKIVVILERFAIELAQVKRSKKYLQLILLTLGLRAAKYLSLYVLLIAVISQWGFKATDLAFLPAFTAFVLAEASASLPASGIMGFGMYQGVWAMVINLFGLNIEKPLSVGLAIQMISQAFSYSLGIISILIFLVLILKNDNITKRLVLKKQY